MENQRERRSLRYEFSNEELLELGKELSVKNQEVSQLEDQKKSVMSEYGSRLNVAKEQVNMLSNRVSTGFEMRDVECDVIFHLPERGMKTLTRTDTAHVWSEKMTGSDWNLFTQFEQEQKKMDEERNEIEGSEVNVAKDESTVPLPHEIIEDIPDVPFEPAPKSGNGKGKKALKLSNKMVDATQETF